MSADPDAVADELLEAVDEAIAPDAMTKHEAVETLAALAYGIQARLDALEL